MINKHKTISNEKKPDLYKLTNFVKDQIFLVQIFYIQLK